MRVLVKEGDALLADLTFEDEEITIGSDPQCAIQLPDQRVPPQSAAVHPRPGNTWELENLLAEDHVQHNGQPVGRRSPLSDGDQITLYDYQLEIRIEQDLEATVVEDTQLSLEELARIRKYPLPAGSIVKRHFEGMTLVQAQLDQAFALGIQVSTCRDIHELIDRSLGLLLEVFEARMAWIGIRRTPEGELEAVGERLRSGHTPAKNPFLEGLVYRCCDRGQYVCVRKIRDQADIGSAMGVPLSTPAGRLGLVYVDRAPRAKRFQIPDLDLLAAFGSAVSAKLNTLLAGQRQWESEINATEIGVAHAIQSLLDPKNPPEWPNFRVAAYSRSGQDQPGNVYDVMRHPDTGITAFLLGHVRAQGAVLALSLARLHATFRVAMLHNDAPQAFARELNWLTHESQQRSLVDLMCLKLDPPTGKIQYARAGRIGAFMVDAQGQPRKLTPADGPSVGAAPNHPYPAAKDCIAPGETLALYTRGVATALNQDGQRFGENRFIELVCDGFGQLPGTTVQDISDEFAEFFADGRHPDDITVILLHHLPAS